MVQLLHPYMTIRKTIALTMVKTLSALTLPTPDVMKPHTLTILGPGLPFSKHLLAFLIPCGLEVFSFLASLL